MHGDRGDRIHVKVRKEQSRVVPGKRMGGTLRGFGMLLHGGLPRRGAGPCSAQAEENRKDRHAHDKHRAGGLERSGHMQPSFLSSFRYAVIILPACCANKIPMGQNCERLGRGE